VPQRPDGSPGDFTDNLNPASLEVVPTVLAEPCVAEAKRPEDGGLYYQFERLGYFVLDSSNVFNKTVGLRDTWGKITKKGL
jgi:glutaminyl-tRNA synthetase